MRLVIQLMEGNPPGNAIFDMYAGFFNVSEKQVLDRGVNNSFERRTGFRDFKGFFEDFLGFFGILWDFLDFLGFLRFFPK